MRKVILFLLAFILLAPVTGEFWHIPFFGFELLPSDILIPVFFILWVLDKWKNDRKLRLGKIGKVIVFFGFAAVLTYLLNAFRFPLQEMLVAGTYLGRFLMYVILSLITFDLLKRDPSGRTLKVALGSMMLSAVMISFLGFLQLKYFPSFLELGLDVEGWDPHIGRLLSTWFDPNFVGGYLAFILGITLALMLYFWHQKKITWAGILVAISVVGLLALYYTFSRSGYLALLFTIGLLAFLKSPRLLLAAIILALLGFTFSPRVQERVTEAFESGKAFIGFNSEYALDPTARLRVESWGYALDIIQDYSLIGAGFGRYAYETVQRGYKLPSDHDVGGSDSSLLTLWATTGIVGLLSYLAIGFVAAVQGIRRAWKKKDFQSYLAAGLLASFGGVMAHSVFVNSLFYALMMGTLWVGLGLLDYRD